MANSIHMHNPEFVSGFGDLEVKIFKNGHLIS